VRFAYNVEVNVNETAQRVHKAEDRYSCGAACIGWVVQAKGLLRPMWVVLSLSTETSPNYTDVCS
jgi:hypothetical protein